MTRLAHTPPAPQPAITTPAAPGSLGIVVVPVSPTRSVVQLDGELDFATAAVAADALREQLALGHRYVILDLAQLSFLDCAGLRVLIRAHDEFLLARGTLVLAGVGQRVARLLSITRLDETLFVADGPGQPRGDRHLSSVGTGVDDRERL